MQNIAVFGKSGVNGYPFLKLLDILICLNPALDFTPTSVIQEKLMK